MLFATFLGLLLIPVFYVVVRRLLGDKLDEPSKSLGHEPGSKRDDDRDAPARPAH